MKKSCTHSSSLAFLTHLSNVLHRWNIVVCNFAFVQMLNEMCGDYKNYMYKWAFQRLTSCSLFFSFLFYLYFCFFKTMLYASLKQDFFIKEAINGTRFDLYLTINKKIWFHFINYTIFYFFVFKTRKTVCQWNKQKNLILKEIKIICLGFSINFIKICEDSVKCGHKFFCFSSLKNQLSKNIHQIHWVNYFS